MGKHLLSCAQGLQPNAAVIPGKRAKASATRNPGFEVFWTSVVTEMTTEASVSFQRNF
jgi:hypothetical protein